MAKKKKLIKGLWSKDDVKLLKKLFANRATQEVADQLGRSLRSEFRRSAGVFEPARHAEALAGLVPADLGQTGASSSLQGAWG